MTDTPSDNSAVRLDRVTAVSRRRLVVNAVASYGDLAVSVALGFYLHRWLVQSLGAGQYALWPLVNSCVAVLALLPKGVGSGAGRFIAHALGRRRLDEAEQITTSLFCILTAVALVYAALTVLLSVYFEQLFRIPAGAAGVGPWAMLFVGLSGAVSLPFGVFAGGLFATQRLIAIHAIHCASLAMRVVLIVSTMSWTGASLLWVGVIYFAVTLLTCIAQYVLSRRLVRWQRIRLRSFRWGVLKKVTAYSGAILVGAIARLLYWKTDSFMINRLMDPVLLTGYAVVAMFLMESSQLVSRGSHVLLPAAAVLHAEGDLGRLSRMLRRTNRVIVPVGVPVLLLLVVFGGELLTAYIGEQYAHYAPLFAILAVYAISAAPQSSAMAVPYAFGRMKTVAIAALIAAVANVLLSFLFIQFGWGLCGLAAGTAVAAFIHWMVFWPWYTARMLKVPLWEHLWGHTLAPLAHCVPVLGVLLGLKGLGMGRGWTGLLLVGAIAMSFQAAYMLLWGMPSEDRRMARRLLGRAGRFVLSHWRGARCREEGVQGVDPAGQRQRGVHAVHAGHEHGI